MTQTWYLLSRNLQQKNSQSFSSGTSHPSGDGRLYSNNYATRFDL